MYATLERVLALCESRRGVGILHRLYVQGNSMQVVLSDLITKSI